jgi:diguanylate cyclase (GGDEF)-like protein
MLFDFMDTSLYWLVAVAGAGLTVMVGTVIFAATIRQVSIAAWVSRTLSKAPTMRGRMLIGLVLVGAIPVLTLPPILMLENVRTRQVELADELRADASNLAHGMESYTRQYIAGIDALAAHISTQDKNDKATLNGWLLRHHKANPEFVSTWIASPRGEVLAATALLEGDQKPWVGPIAGVALMDFFQASVENGGLYVSPVEKGVEPLFDPMIIVSAPVYTAGQELLGYLQAQLNLRRVYRNVVSYGSIPGRPAFITDEKDRVMVTSPEISFAKFQTISGHPVVRNVGEARGGTYGFEGAIEKGQPVARYVSFHTSLEGGWKVYAIASIEGMQTQAFIFMGLSLVWVLIVLFLAVNLAGVYGGIVSAPLQELHHSMDIFDAEHTLKMVPRAPVDAPAEIASVFRRLRVSMEQSRDSYHNMLRAITEGDDLRQKYQSRSKNSEAMETGATDADESGSSAKKGAADKGKPKSKSKSKKGDAKSAAKKSAVPGYKDRLDSLTELAGRAVFEEFFGDAWMLGYSDSRPMSLLFFSIGFGSASAESQGGSYSDEIFRTAGKILKKIPGRQLDFVARIDADRFALVLPDTDLYGALVVADKARVSLHDQLPADSGDYMLGANVGVASITPTPAGDAASFIKSTQRVLIDAEKKGGSHIAYLDEKLETHVLKPGDSLPSAPPLQEKVKEKAEQLASVDPGSSGMELALAQTYVSSEDAGVFDEGGAPEGAINLLADVAPQAESAGPPPAEPDSGDEGEDEGEDPTVYANWSEGEIDLDDIDWED